MNLKSLIVIGFVLVVGATTTLSAQSAEFNPRVVDRLLGLGFDWFRTPLQGRVVKSAPYSAEITTESVQTLSDGNRIVHRSSEKVYRDAEGRVRREVTNGTKVTVTITDPVANKSLTLEPATRTWRQTALLLGFSFYNLTKPLGGYTWSYRGASGGRGSVTGTISADAKGGQGDFTVGFRKQGVKPRLAGEQYLEEQLANRTIEGVVASGVRRTTTIPQGAIGNELPIKIVSEEWTAVDLDVLVLTDVNDPRTGRSTYKLSNISRADPDPALFKVPAGYTRAGRK